MMWLVVLFAFAQASGAQQNPVIGMNDDLALSADQVMALELQAADGSAEAATRLFQYYEYVREDYLAATKWMTVAAENGDFTSYCNLAKLLRREKDDYSQRRAVFWKTKCDAGP